MKDNVLIANLFTVLRAGMDAQGYTTTHLASSYQPTQQGVNKAPTLFLFKLGDHRLGFLARTDVWDPDAQVMVHTETQLYETMFQINGLAEQDPSDVTLPTASDLVNAACAVMQSDVAREALFAQGMNVYRFIDVRNPYFQDDHDRYEAAPSFDFTIQHAQVLTTTSPVATRTIINIDRV